MRRAAALFWLPVLTALAGGGGIEARPHRDHRRILWLFVDPYGVDIPREPFFSEPPLNPQPPDLGYEPPIVPEPSPQPPPGPYPQGFILTVPIRAGRDSTDETRPTQSLQRYADIGGAMQACWTPPTDFDDKPWRDITLRVSFKRDGSINGVPRVSHTDEGLTPDGRSGLTRSLLDALHRCAPLPFSPGLGRAIAGQIFALRFREQDQDR